MEEDCERCRHREAVFNLLDDLDAPIEDEDGDGKELGVVLDVRNKLAAPIEDVDVDDGKVFFLVVRNGKSKRLWHRFVTIRRM